MPITEQHQRSQPRFSTQAIASRVSHAVALAIYIYLFYPHDSSWNLNEFFQEKKNAIGFLHLIYVLWTISIAKGNVKLF